MKSFIMVEVEQKFKVGDVVTLKSGGQNMTITKVIVSAKTKTFNGLFDCQWFIGNSLKTATFNQDTLLLSTGEPL